MPIIAFVASPEWPICGTYPTFRQINNLLLCPFVSFWVHVFKALDRNGKSVYVVFVNPHETLKMTKKLSWEKWKDCAKSFKKL